MHAPRCRRRCRACPACRAGVPDSSLDALHEVASPGYSLALAAGTNVARHSSSAPAAQVDSACARRGRRRAPAAAVPSVPGRSPCRLGPGGQVGAHVAEVRRENGQRQTPAGAGSRQRHSGAEAQPSEGTHACLSGVWRVCEDQARDASVSGGNRPIACAEGPTSPKLACEHATV